VPSRCTSNATVAPLPAAASTGMPVDLALFYRDKDQLCCCRSAASQSRKFIPPWNMTTFVHDEAADRCIERNDGQPHALDIPNTRTALAAKTDRTTTEGRTC